MVIQMPPFPFFSSSLQWCCVISPFVCLMRIILCYDETHIFIKHYKYPVTKAYTWMTRRRRKKHTQNECVVRIYNDNQRWKMYFVFALFICVVLLAVYFWTFDLSLKGFSFLLKKRARLACFFDDKQKKDGTKCLDWQCSTEQNHKITWNLRWIILTLLSVYP